VCRSNIQQHLLHHAVFNLTNDCWSSHEIDNLRPPFCIYSRYSQICLGSTKKGKTEGGALVIPNIDNACMQLLSNALISTELQLYNCTSVPVTYLDRRPEPHILYEWLRKTAINTVCHKRNHQLNEKTVKEISRKLFSTALQQTCIPPPDANPKSSR
jgi:hypothetical protein